MKHKADAPDCRDWHSTVRHILLAIKSLSGPITWSTDRSAAQKIKLILQQDQRVTPFLSPPRSFSYPQRQHSADRCCGDCRWRWHWPSRTGLPPAWLRSSSGSSGSRETTNMHMTLFVCCRQRWFNTITPIFVHWTILCQWVCTCRQSARRCSSLWGRASRGDSAPSASSRICGPWHSTWRHVSLCTLRLLGFPSLLNRKDLCEAVNSWRGGDQNCGRGGKNRLETGKHKAYVKELLLISTYAPSWKEIAWGYCIW